MPLLRRGGTVAALLTCAFALVPPAASAASVGSWSIVGQPVDRNDAASARLGDGTVLVAGGDTSADHTTLATADRFDPATNTWTAVAPMHAARYRAAGVALLDGRALVAGGGLGAEVFDPVANTWTSTGPMDVPNRDLSKAVLLADGRVLLVGDSRQMGAHGAEVYDPATNAWTPTGSMTAPGRDDATITRLKDGRVLAAGGYAGIYEDSAEIYDPATNGWTRAASMHERRYGAGAALLPDGRVLVAGGHGFWNGAPTASATAETYDPVSDSWTTTGSTAIPRGEGNTMVALADGRPMIIGGFWWTDVHPGAGAYWSGGRYENSAEIYDPAAGTWTRTADMSYGRAGQSSVVLGDGNLLITGGWGSGGGPTERFVPPSAPSSAPSGGASPASVVTPPAAVTLARPAAKPVKHAALAGFPGGISRRLTVSPTGRVVVRVSCAGPSTCHDELRLTTRGKHARTLGRAKFAARAGKRTAVTIKLSASVRRSLRRHTTKALLTLVARKRTLDVTVRG